jgi:hypothetical protein
VLRCGEGSIAILIQFKLTEARYLTARAILSRLLTNLRWDIPQVVWGPKLKIRAMPCGTKLLCMFYCNTDSVQADRSRIPQCKRNLKQNAPILWMGYPIGDMWC